MRGIHLLPAISAGSIRGFFISNRTAMIFSAHRCPASVNAVRSRNIGEDEGQRLLTSMLHLHEIPTLAQLVRRIVGKDRSAAGAAFAISLADCSLCVPLWWPLG